MSSAAKQEDVVSPSAGDDQTSKQGGTDKLPLFLGSACGHQASKYSLPKELQTQPMS